MAPTRGLIVAAILAATLAAGCGAAGDPTAQGGPCASIDDVDQDAVATCAAAVALADARLGWLHWPVSLVQFRRDLCPPNARCRFPGERQGWVIYLFSNGDSTMVHVSPADEARAAPLVAGKPEPLPDWLLAEMTAPQPGG